MYLLAVKIMSFRELAVVILGELSPGMSFMYDIVACVYAFIFIMIIYSFFTFISRRRW